jgi:SAM-dependent methyltransferase
MTNGPELGVGRTMLKQNAWNIETDYYQLVEHGYDALASRYDREIGSNTIGNRMHAVFRRALVPTFSSGQLIFEVGCGTGIEALWLARQGVNVVATDISAGMLEELRSKAKSEGLGEQVLCRKLAAGEIGVLASEFGSGSFDGGYSHAGALNMEPAIHRVPHQIRDLVRPGGNFVCSVINKTSLFEVLFYPLVLRPRKAFRRMDNVVPIPIARSGPMSRFVIPARFYSPSDMLRIFREGFMLRATRGLCVFLPPSNLADLYSTIQPAFRPFEILEDWLSGTWPFRMWGHHTVLTFRRV